ncbi:glycosyltransferase [Natronobacterium texcoconense]|uniref:Glycosyl transferase family 21 n=1 Tax=Natronobacterium texcoconense TaxID=1095778 RepID=A0A1H1B318_NATTX|nr:glycosyltransferase family 2 protein [Natronobacterium texcoconense]SDQ46171.1 Glycosyl transferase family 21 [Natronobacterium texcoconense]
MADYVPTSVVLPTTGWNGACAEVVAQLREEDELLVVCDDENEAVADRVADVSNARLVVAGDPEGCSGKANAVAAGMEAAEHDRIAWSDDDYHHPPDWLEGLRQDYEEHGPVSETPVFVGQDPLGAFLEPTQALSGTLMVYVADIPWGGAVMFERDDLGDEDAFLEELRRTVSDDGLLSEYVDVTTLGRTRRVEIGGSARESLENQVRFTQIVRNHDVRGIALMTGIATVLTAVAVLFPLPMLALTTLSMAAIYAAFGIRRWTFLTAYPVLLASVPLTLYGLARHTFVWGGRRYRWEDKFDVTVVSE